MVSDLFVPTIPTLHFNTPVTHAFYTWLFYFPFCSFNLTPEFSQFLQFCLHAPFTHLHSSYSSTFFPTACDTNFPLFYLPHLGLPTYPQAIYHLYITYAFLHLFEGLQFPILYLPTIYLHTHTTTHPYLLHTFYMPVTTYLYIYYHSWISAVYLLTYLSFPDIFPLGWGTGPTYSYLPSTYTNF